MDAAGWYLRRTAGGGTFYCGRLSNMKPWGKVVGEWGHWTVSEIDDPRPSKENCWEPRKEGRTAEEEDEEE